MPPKSVKFQWPMGKMDELEEYSTCDPQRKPTEEFFINEVRNSIKEVRDGDCTNLWLLIDSLKGLSDSEIKSGFETWLWAIGTVLGAKTCREIGQQVCQEEEFTLKEALQLMEIHHHKEANKYGLSETASWDEIYRQQDTQIPLFEV